MDFESIQKLDFIIGFTKYLTEEKVIKYDIEVRKVERIAIVIIPKHEVFWDIFWLFDNFRKKKYYLKPLLDKMQKLSNKHFFIDFEQVVTFKLKISIVLEVSNISNLVAKRSNISSVKIEPIQKIY